MNGTETIAEAVPYPYTSPHDGNAHRIRTLFHRSPGSGRPAPGAPKLKPRWDVHSSGDDDQMGCAGESLSSVLGE